jgi:hypothetical protein
MEINYDEIITKANARAEQLKEIQRYGADAETHAVALLSAMLYFSNLNQRICALDAEGKAMVGGLVQRASLVGGTCSNTYEYLTTLERTNNSDTRMVMKLAEALK